MTTSPTLTSSPLYRITVFYIGIIATIAYRILLILTPLGKTWVDTTWYIGTIGFVWYFAHRYHVERKRDGAGRHANLLQIERRFTEKLENGSTLSTEDRSILAAELKSLLSSRSRWNYIAIFIASGVALAYDIIIRLVIT